MISDEGRIAHRAGRVRRFLRNQPATRTDALGSMRRRPASDRNQALIGRFRVKMIGFRAVCRVRAGHRQPYTWLQSSSKALL